ncbi:sensor histidine kinase [Tenacibaculum amylolyticum]|uniref:sensor histidine kinase n=1 Tax=Tenacibaculum amylolyticum TaxID=104269 RepID=UPI0038B5D585
MKSNIIYLLFFLGCTTLFAQHPLYVQLTEKDGLPDIEFYGILEDSKGFIWLAAEKGLYRYDGKKFKNYTTSGKRALSVFGLHEGTQGKIWCNNISGQYFTVENDSLKLFIDLKEYTKGQLGEFDFYGDKMSVSIVGRMFSVDLKTKQTVEVTPKNKLISYTLKKQDTLFFLEDNVLKYQTHKETREWSTLPINITPPYFSKAFIFGKYFLHQVYNRKKRESTFYFGADTLKQIKDIKFDKDQELIRTFKDGNDFWLCTVNAIYVYTFREGKFHFKAKYFEGKKVTEMMKDSRGNYWFITSGNGIFIIPNIHIMKYQLPKEDENITALEKINDSILIFGTTSGKTNKINTITAKSETLVNSHFRRVNKIAYNKKDEVYVSLTNSSFVLNSKTFQLKPNSRVNKFRFNNAKGLSIINENKFIYSSFAFADILDKKKEQAIRIGNRRSYTNHYSKSKNEIYVSYVDGVEYYKEDLKPHAITFKGQPIFGIDIDETSDGTIWISTFNDGIIGVKDGKSVFNYNITNGLLSNQTSTIKGEGKYLWVVTDKGIQHLNTQTGNFKSITRTDGIETFNISDIAISKEKVFFGSNKGIFELDKQKVFKKHKLPDFQITDVYIEDQKVGNKAAYELSADENKIQFHFHANGYQSEINSIYLYKLIKNGKKEIWNTIPKGSNQVTFNSLSPGNYEFELKAIQRIEGKETAVKKVEVKVNAPFYKRWWFVTLILLGVSGYVMYYYRKALSEKEKEKQRLLAQIENEKEMVFLKLENLRSQMNPHFIFNALNSIQDYILLNQKNLAGDYLGKFADLIRIYLNHSSKAYISLEEEIDTLEKYLELEKLRFEDTLSYEITTKSEINREEIEIPTMLIQPYIENALKHGLLHKKEERKLTISFILDEEKHYILCKVTDNGVGRDKANALNSKRKKYHRPFATKATQDRITLLNHEKNKKIQVEIIDLFTEKNIPSGTQVIIKIPYRKL